MSLLDDAIAGHGGRRHWNKVSELSAQVRSGGLLLRMKRKTRKFSDFRVTIDAARQQALLDPYPEPGQRGIFDHGNVRIETDAGELVEGRENAREWFFGAHGIARKVRWDDLDALYFVGYAIWNYLTTPFMFEMEGFRVEEGEPLEEDDETWRRLDVSFPASIHTHCPEQTFYFDDAGLLRRHDYHPEVVSNLAGGVHLSNRYHDFDGLRFATSRRVLPKGPLGHPLPGPTLVWIELNDIQLEGGLLRAAAKSIF